LWSYYPNHLKGWMLLIGGVLAANVLPGPLLGLPEESPATFVVFAICIVAILIMADRHAED